MSPLRRMATICSALTLLILGGNSSLWAQNISVTSATPNNAAQGTINLNVVIGGNGFKNGAKAQWFISGTTNPGGVTVNSTTFNSSTQLTANITVSTTATVGDFDVVVTAGTRSGKGTQLFSVTKDAPTNACGTSVTTTVFDTDSNGLPLQLESDGLGPYVTYTINTHKDFVNSAIQGSCNYLLNTSSSQSRTVKLSLKYVGSNGATLPPGWPADGSFVNVPVRIESSCTENPPNNNITFGTMTFAGETLQCSLFISFYVNGTAYGTRMSPNLYAGTTWVQATCTGAVSNICNSWTITPIPNLATNPSTGQATGIGELVQTTALGAGTGTPMGLYYVSFSIALHE